MFNKFTFNLIFCFLLFNFVFGQRDFPAVHPRSLLLTSNSKNGEPSFEQRVKAFPARTTTIANKTPLFSRSTFNLFNNPTLTTTGKPAFTGKPGCQVDIVLLIDMSGGAVDKREHYLALASDLVRQLDIGVYSAQVALVRYSGRGRTDTVFRLKNRHNQTSLINELSQIQALGGTTRTKEAMLHAKREFEKKFGGREKADKIMIVFTDGYSQDDPSDIAADFRKEKIHIYAVAVEDEELKPNEEQLKVIASDPQSVIIGTAQFANLKQKVAQARCRQ
uniref:VWFA domain-containing protein n=1 Tax=Meloidogyne incognita TaxID=6306 RepID=A0A914N0V5_MELIC